MSFGQNLQFLRKMQGGMTQEELAEKLCVSRQTVSKWELDTAYPEIGKVIELCSLFSCTMDQLIREDMTLTDKAYSNIRFEWVEAFRYLPYAVISREPEDDAKAHVKKWAAALQLDAPQIIGWDFPMVSQEQINVFNMQGYAAAWILPDGVTPGEGEALTQQRQKYIAVTIKSPSSAPFRVIPGAYRLLMSRMEHLGIRPCHDKAVISCFEKEYVMDGTEYMDVCIAVE